MYRKVEEYMPSCMNGGAYNQHIYCVLYNALDIAREYDALSVLDEINHTISRTLESKKLCQVS